MAKKNTAPTGAGNMKAFYGILALIVVVGVAAILYARSRTGSMATEPLDLSEIGDANALMSQARGVELGEPDAPVHMIVFSDFSCPGCGHWAGQVEPFIKRDLIANGTLRMTYYDLPLVSLHEHAFLAARASRCAGDQGRFWEYHDRLFGTQSRWSYTPSPPTDQFLQFARDVGIDAGEFEQCLRSDRHADVVSANVALAQSLGVGGTPTVFVNGRQLDNTSWQRYELVRLAVNEAAGTAGGTEAAQPADAAAPDSAAAVPSQQP